MNKRLKRITRHLKIYEKLVYKFLIKNSIDSNKIIYLTKKFKVDYYSILIILKDIKKDYNFFKTSDKALKDYNEIIVLNSFKAIMYYRLSHLLYVYQDYLMARCISEISHSFSQIDIHPGAIISSPFYIDHGTGIVIGETCIIGKFVKLYHGVTLGARLTPNENKLKRHPTICDNVTIYCNSSIFGNIKIFNDTIIKSHSIIK